MTATVSPIVEAPELDPCEFASTLRDLALFTASDQARPVLRQVRISEDAGVLTFEATDSYVLARAQIPGTLGVPVVFVDRGEVKRITDTIKAGAKFQTVPVMITVADGRLTVESREGSVSVPVSDDSEISWPNTAQLWDSSHDRHGSSVERCGFRDHVLTTLAKLAKSTGKDLVLDFVGELKPAYWTCGTVEGLAMPVRIPEQSTPETVMRRVDFS